MGYQWTPEAARRASLKRVKGRKLYLDSRKVDGKYEYLVKDADGTTRWLTRQAIFHRRHRREIRAKRLVARQK